MPGRKILLFLSPSCFAVCGHQLVPGITIVFSLLHLAHEIFLNHIRLFSSSPTHPVLLLRFTFSHSVRSTLFLLCRKGTPAHLLPPPPDYWYLVYLFLLFDKFRSPARNRGFSVFAQSIGPSNYVFIPIFSLKTPPEYHSSVPPHSSCFLALAIPFFLAFLVLPVLQPPNFSMDSISSWLPPMPFHTL